MNCISTPALAGLLVLAAAQTASAQSVISPTNVNPYSRTSLSPYLKYGRGGDTDFRNPLLQPVMVAPDFWTFYEAVRPFPGRPEYAVPLDSFDKWYEQQLKERYPSPSGYSIEFMSYGPYYDLPNQNSFVPTAPNRSRPYR